MSDTLQAWTIYDHPADYPNFVAIRCFQISSAEPEPTALPEVHLLASVSEARQWLARHRPGLTCFPRSAGDVPAIVETWL